MEGEWKGGRRWVIVQGNDQRHESGARKKHGAEDKGQGFMWA